MNFDDDTPFGVYNSWQGYFDDITSLSDTTKRYIYSSPITQPLTSTWAAYDMSNSTITQPFSSDDIKEVKTVISKERDPFSIQDSYMISCKDKSDLSVENILRTIAIMKAKLCMEISFDTKVKWVECYMTPEVKKNIIIASKKLSMYGRYMPIVSRFDEYGRKLPDTFALDPEEKMKLEIVNSASYGAYYIAMKAVEKDTSVFYDPYIK